MNAGLFVDWEDVRVWLESIGTDHPLPLPTARRGPRQSRERLYG
jgi:hypothetical protein